MDMILYLLIALTVVSAGPVLNNNDDDQQNGGNKNAMEGIYEVNEHMDQSEASEMVDMDERFELGVPDETDDIPEGVQFGLLRKQYGRLWKDGIVHFRISSSYSEQQKEVIRQATRDIAKESCIRFKELMRDDPNIHHIFVVNKGGCWSFVGKALGRKNQELSLKVPGCLHKSIATHEFIHALGVFHEQARPDRDQYVEIHPENMQPNTLKQFYKKDSIDSLGIPYDIQSIMHYSNFAFSNNRGPTISWKGNPTKKLGGNVMSKSDITQINLLYGCQNQSIFPTTRPPPTTTTRRSTTTTRRPTTTTRRPTTTTRRPTTTTRRPTTSKPTTTQRTFDGCNEASWCRYVYNLSLACRAASIQLSCPVRCNRCNPKPTTTTRRTTTTTRRTTTTTRRTTTTTRKPTTTTQRKTTTLATRRPIDRDCFDVSFNCQHSSGNCHREIYQRRCRKSCGQCRKPLPSECQGRRDQMRNCSELTKNGCHVIPHWQRQFCNLSCCLRREL